MFALLRACKTGLGDVQNGKGVYGLRRALALAGVESQLMSLWAVNDYRTNQLMINYYQRLKNNMGRSDAFRKTQWKCCRSLNLSILIIGQRWGYRSSLTFRRGQLRFVFPY